MTQGGDQGVVAFRRLSRREAVGAGALAAAALTLPGPINHAAIARAKRRPLAREGRFDSGVASGFPRPRGTVLWTRLSGLERTSRVRYEVARDRNFRRVVARDTALARRRDDFAVKASIRGLEPGRPYWYRFFTREGSSPVGRMRTAPPFDSAQPVRIGFFSCQHWGAGYYNAHAALAREADLDLVVCLGDYIYETGGADRRDNPDRTGDNSDGVVEHLREYRQKYRLYRSDPDLQAMHAAHPFTAIWDDHEVEDNIAGDQSGSGVAEGRTPSGAPRRVSYERRRANGFRAFFESMPRLRRPINPDRIYDRGRLGGLVDLLALDTRQYRDPQPCGDELLVPCPDQNDPARTKLGAQQKGWLRRRLRGSTAAWRVIANQAMMMGFESVPGTTFNVDQWDGYSAERRELMQFLHRNRIDNVVTLTGDIHTFFAGEVTPSGNGYSSRPAATEFIGGSITSDGIADIVGMPPETFQLIADRAPLTNPHIKYIEVQHKGYGVITARPDELICEFKGVRSIASRDPDVDFTLARFRVPAGRAEVQRL